MPISASPMARRAGMRSPRRGVPPWMARRSPVLVVSIAAPLPPLLCQAEPRRHLADVEPMRREQLVVAAVVVDEFVPQREGAELAARLDVPGDLLDLRRQAALRRVLLDDDDAAMLDERPL